MELRVLGPVEVVADGRPVPLGGPKQRTVLAVLVAWAGRVVSVGRLSEALWGLEPPGGARNTIQTYVSNLRGTLGDLIGRRGDAYLLEVDREAIDALRFEDQVASARDLLPSDPARAAQELREGLALWRGRPFADVDARGVLRAEVTRLEELRLVALEARIEAELAAGNHVPVTGELEALTAEHPLRERLRALHMVALYRSGRQAEALRAYQRTRTYLADELGIDPSPELQDLEQRILTQDPSLEADARPRVESLTFLFTDIEDSTALWELHGHAMAEAVDLHAQVITEAVEGAGGRVAKRTGDGMDAVFTEVSQAVAAAVGAQRALARAPWGETGPLGVRMAIDQGEVEVRGTDYFGPTLNRLGRILASAHGGQVLLSAPAHRALSEAEGGWAAKALGEHRFRGLGRPQAVFQVVADGLPGDFPPLRVDRPAPPRGFPGFGRVVRGYELREQVGAGDFGVVYRAYQPSVGREVAIKVIHPDYVGRPAFIRRFEAAAQMVARLEHPHIVPLYDWWRDPDGAYLVTRWLRGGSLRDALERGPFHPEAALELLSQAGGALAHAHRQGVAHRDLKPGNVLLDRDGNAYLADFRVATRMVDASEAPRPLSSSPAYLAPEELEGEPLTPRSDLFCLGLVAFEVLSGRRPPMDGPLPALADAHPQLPPAVDEVIAWATAPRPADRPPDVEAFLSALGEALGETVELPEVPFTPARNPYKGLHPFGEADREDFFGREAFVAELLAAVEARRLVAVVGPSGVGKSSVVRAGLIPALRAGGLPGSREWLITTMFPGSWPFEELEAALLRVAVTDPPEGLVDLLSTDHRGLLRVSKRLVPPDTEVVVVVDQFEELFSLTPDEETRASFLEALVTAATDARSRLRVLLTLRADFFDRPLRYPRFGELLREGTVPLAAPGDDELRAAIAEPARGVGVRLEPGLPERILSDVAGQPGALPLLQYALTEAFSRRHSDLLTVDGYQAAGGVMGALGRRAERLYEELDEGAQEAARQVFLRLVRVEERAEDTRRRVRRSELERLGLAPEVLQEILDAYGAYRLLSFDRDPTTRGPTVEVAHEALLGEWERLRTWIEDRRQDLLVHRRIAEAASQWREAQRDPSYLLRGGRLDQAEAWAEGTDLLLTEGERKFLATGREEENRRLARRRRRRRGILVGFALAAVVATILALVAFANQRQAEQQAALALERQAEAEVAQAEATQNERLAEARTLAASAINVLDQDPELSILLALESLALAPESDAGFPEGMIALREALDAPRPLARFQVADCCRTPAALSSDGRRLVISSRAERKVWMYDVETQEVLWVYEQPSTVDSFNNVLFNPDDSLVALEIQDVRGPGEVDEDEVVLDEQGEDAFPARIVILDAASGEVVHTIEPGSCSFIGLGGVPLTSSFRPFSPDGRWLIVWTGDEGCGFPPSETDWLVLYDTLTWEPGPRIDHGQVEKGAFSADGAKLLVRGGGASTQLLSFPGMELLQEFEESDMAGLSPDGERIVLVKRGRPGEFRPVVRDVRTGALLDVLNVDGFVRGDFLFTPEGRRIIAATGGPDVVWEVEDQLVGPQPIKLPSGNTIGNSLSGDGSLLATAHADGTVLLWRPEQSSVGTPLETESIWINPDWIKEGRRTALWTLAPRLPEEINRAFRILLVVIDPLTAEVHHELEIFASAQLPDGRFVVTLGRLREDGDRDIGPLSIWDPDTDSLQLMDDCRLPESILEERGPFTCPDGEPHYGISLAVHNSGTEFAALEYRPSVELSETSSIRFYDVATLEPTRTITIPVNPATLLAYRDGWILADPAVPTARWIIDAATGDLIEGEGLEGVGVGPALAAEGRLYVAPVGPGGAGSVWVYDTTTWAKVAEFAAHDANIRGLALSPDGTRLATAGEDDFVKIWDLDDFTLLDRIPIEFPSDAMWIDDDHLGVALPHGVRWALVPIDPDDVIASARESLTRDLTPEECRLYEIERCMEG